MAKRKQTVKRAGPKAAASSNYDSQHLNLLWKAFIRLSREIEIMEALLKDLP